MSGVFSLIKFDSFTGIVDYFIITKFKKYTFKLSNVEQFEVISDLAASNKELNAVIIKWFVRLVEHYYKWIDHDDREEVDIAVDLLSRYAIQLINCNDSLYPTREFSRLFGLFVRPMEGDKSRIRKYFYVTNKINDIFLRGVGDLEESHKTTRYERKKKSKNSVH